MTSAVTRRSVNVIMLGRMGFIPAFDLQSRYARDHLDEMAGKPSARGEHTLLLVEHRPVYTVGIRNKDYTPDDVERLKRTGAEFYTTNRGGLITFHGPGQLVAYPILNLTRFKPSMKWYVGRLEQTILETLRRFGLKGRLTDQTGVWVDDRKIASIGLHGSRYVTTHGISLNCDTDLTWFKSIVPCGLHGVEITSLTKELSRPVTVTDATRPFLNSFREVFDCELEYRMLEEDDMSLIEEDQEDGLFKKHYQTDDAAKSAPSDAAEVISVPKIDPPRVEMGVRLMSTLSSSPSASQESTALQSSSSPSSLPSSSPAYSFSPLSKTKSNPESGPSGIRVKAWAPRRIIPMW